MHDLGKQLQVDGLSAYKYTSRTRQLPSAIAEGALRDAKSDVVPHQKIIDAYHQILPMGTPVKVWRENRAKLLRARWREDTKRQNVDWWRRFFEHISRSPFLTGKTEWPFQISLEWIVRPTNFDKIREGHYDRREAA